MSDLVLVLGNCNYSSWSLRAWLALEQSGLDFRERQIWLEEDTDRSQRLKFAPTGRVPVLLDGGSAIWDSLAIAEYLAELAPRAGLWPAERAARARARALCCEMHAGFPAVREQMPLNVRARTVFRDRGPEVAAEARRLISIWETTRQQFGVGGPFLFGRRSLADAFFAPVASRFQTYAVGLQGAAADWAATVLALPAMRQWRARAEAEGRPNRIYDALLDPGCRNGC